MSGTSQTSRPSAPFTTDVTPSISVYEIGCTQYCVSGPVSPSTSKSARTHAVRVAQRDDEVGIDVSGSRRAVRDGAPSGRTRWSAATTTDQIMDMNLPDGQSHPQKPMHRHQGISVPPRCAVLWRKSEEKVPTVLARARRRPSRRKHPSRQVAARIPPVHSNAVLVRRRTCSTWPGLPEPAAP